MGQTLTKIAYYGEDNNLTLYTIPTKNNFEKIHEFLESKIGLYEKFRFTGGKAFSLFKLFQQKLRKIESSLHNEFQANIIGIEFLYLLNKKEKLPNSLIVTIGTGTSIVLKTESFKHLGGSSLGGGLFMGLIILMCNIYDFEEAMSKAKKGNQYNIDLKVSDIYEPEDERIDSIFREYIASSFGKIDTDFDLNSIQNKDIINSIVFFIGDNIGRIALLMAENNNIDDIVFCGGFLRGNKPLKRILNLLCKIYKKRAIFLRNSEFCGAIGALLG